MEKKQILKVKHTLTPDIVKICYAKTAYVNQYFFENSFDDLNEVESDDCKSYPVNIVAIRFDWFFD